MCTNNRNNENMKCQCSVTTAITIPSQLLRYRMGVNDKQLFGLAANNKYVDATAVNCNFGSPLVGGYRVDCFLGGPLFLSSRKPNEE